MTLDSVLHISFSYHLLPLAEFSKQVEKHVQKC